MRRPREEENGAQEVAELAALADGTLAPERRARLESRVAASSDLADRLAEQQRAVTLVRSAAEEVEAPSALRARIEAQRHGSRVDVPRRLLVIGASATTVLAVAIGHFRSDTSTEQFRAALAPTALLPGATGEAMLTNTPSGWRIELDATGLPRLENGRYYQPWLRNTVGVLVPIGTFNDGREVTLWAGVPPTDFTTLSVTREQADGDQASSGEKVLVGTIDTEDSG
jgi:anti-sigma-K factor RskA